MCLMRGRCVIWVFCNVGCGSNFADDVAINDIAEV